MIKKTMTFLLCVSNRQKWAGLFLGLFLFLCFVCTDPSWGMSKSAWNCVGMAALMATWWASEAMPIAATSLLPIILVPMLGLGDVKTATASYAHPTIYLFFGGFLLGLAMEKCNLHRRIALNVLVRVGSSPTRQIAGFMAATAFISMWVSNTATAIMMLPIGTSVCAVVTQGQNEEDSRRFASALMLSIAYASSIGGMGTLIGTPPNAILRAFLADNYDIVIGFGEWMILGVPLAILLCVFTWWWLTRKGFHKLDGSGIHTLIEEEIRELGPMSRAEKITALVFVGAAVSWILQPIIRQAIPFVDDTFIAMFFGILLFLIPLNTREYSFVMDWSDARKLPWSVLLLFGGGLSMAAAIKNAGLASWMAGALSGLQGIPIVIMLLILVYVIQGLTEFTSNTATAAAFLPLVGVMAVAHGLDPTIYAIPAALAASCAFMLPVSTPPNALVFRSGAIKIADMIRAGFALTLVSGLLLTFMAYVLVPMIFVR